MRQQDFVVTMAPADQQCWWCRDQTADQKEGPLPEGQALLTAVTGNAEVGNTAKSAAIITSLGPVWWWHPGPTGE